MKRAIAVFICMLFLMCSCEKKKPDLYIGVNLELSGAYAQYGEAAMQGIELALSEYGNDNVKVEYFDNHSDNGESAQNTLRIKALGCDMMIGPVTSGCVRSAISVEKELTIITPSATADIITEENSGNLIRLCFTDNAQGTLMGKVCAKKLGYLKCAVLCDITSDYSCGSSSAFRKSYIRNGGKITDMLYFGNGDTDFYALLSKIKKKLPDCIYLPSYYTQAGLVIRQARELGMDCAFVGGDAFDSPLLEQLAGGNKNLIGTVFSNHFDYSGADNGFFSRFYTHFGHYPQSYSALSYDCFNFAVMRADKNLIGLKFNGVCGELQVDSNGNAVKEIFITEITPEKKQTLII